MEVHARVNGHGVCEVFHDHGYRVRTGIILGCAGSGCAWARARTPGAPGDTWPRCASHLCVPIQPVTTFVTGAAGLFGFGTTQGARRARSSGIRPFAIARGHCPRALRRRNSRVGRSVGLEFVGARIVNSRPTGPVLTEISEALDRAIAELSVAATSAGRQQLLPEKLAALLDGRFREVTDLRFFEELLDGSSDGRQVWFEDADAAGRLSLVDDRCSGRPVSGAQAAPDGLAGDRSLHRDRTLTAGPAVALVSTLATAEVSSVERQGALRHGDSIGTHHQKATYELMYVDPGTRSFL